MPKMCSKPPSQLMGKMAFVVRESGLFETHGLVSPMAEVQKMTKITLSVTTRG